MVWQTLELGAELVDDRRYPLLQVLARLPALKVGDGLAGGDGNGGRQILYAEDLRHLGHNISVDIAHDELQPTCGRHLLEVLLELLGGRGARRADQSDNRHLRGTAHQVILKVLLGDLEERGNSSAGVSSSGICGLSLRPRLRLLLDGAEVEGSSYVRSGHLFSSR